MKITKSDYEKLNSKLSELETSLNGGKGSGNFGHSGRKGKVGGSGSGQGFSKGQKVTFEGAYGEPVEGTITRKLTDKEKQDRAHLANPDAGDYYEVEYGKGDFAGKTILWEARIKPSKKEGKEISVKDVQKALQPSHDRYTREVTEVKYNPEKDNYEAKATVHFKDKTPDEKEDWFTLEGKDPKDKMSWLKDNSPTFLEEFAERMDRVHGGKSNNGIEKKMIKLSKEDYEKLKNKLENLEKLLNGGKGSGNFGHSGRPGKRGGSGKGDGIKVHEGSGETDYYYAEDGDRVLASGKTEEEALKKAKEKLEKEKKEPKDKSGQESSKKDEGKKTSTMLDKIEKAGGTVYRGEGDIYSLFGDGVDTVTMSKKDALKLAEDDANYTSRTGHQDDWLTTHGEKALSKIKKMKDDALVDMYIRDTDTFSSYPQYRVHKDEEEKNGLNKRKYEELKNKLENLEKLLNGGKGSGNFGHSGRPGKRGGSGGGKGGKYAVGDTFEKDGETFTVEEDGRGGKEGVSADRKVVTTTPDDYAKMRGGMQSDRLSQVGAPKGVTEEVDRLYKKIEDEDAEGADSYLETAVGALSGWAEGNGGTAKPQSDAVKEKINDVITDMVLDTIDVDYKARGQKMDDIVSKIGDKIYETGDEYICPKKEMIDGIKGSIKILHDDYPDINDFKEQASGTIEDLRDVMKMSPKSYVSVSEHPMSASGLVYRELSKEDADTISEQRRKEKDAAAAFWR